MTQKIKIDGREYDISDQFAFAMRMMGKLEFSTSALEAERQGLLRNSNIRELTRQERARLDNVTHIFNVANAVRVIGAHHDPIKEWGLDGWDAVHGNYVKHDCGCITHHVFDHHSVVNHFGHDRVSADRVHHHVEPRRTCRDHIQLAGDPAALHAAVTSKV